MCGGPITFHRLFCKFGFPTTKQQQQHYHPTLSVSTIGDWDVAAELSSLDQNLIYPPRPLAGQRTKCLLGCNYRRRPQAGHRHGGWQSIVVSLLLSGSVWWKFEICRVTVVGQELVSKIKKRFVTPGDARHFVYLTDAILGEGWCWYLTLCRDFPSITKEVFSRSHYLITVFVCDTNFSHFFLCCFLFLIVFLFVCCCPMSFFSFLFRLICTLRRLYIAMFVMLPCCLRLSSLLGNCVVCAASGYNKDNREHFVTFCK